MALTTVRDNRMTNHYCFWPELSLQKRMTGCQITCPSQKAQISSSSTLIGNVRNELLTSGGIESITQDYAHYFSCSSMSSYVLSTPDTMDLTTLDYNNFSQKTPLPVLDTIYMFTSRLFLYAFTSFWRWAFTFCYRTPH